MKKIISIILCLAMIFAMAATAFAATATAPYVEFSVKKVDAADNNKLLEGAVFELVKTDETKTYYATSGPDGMATFAIDFEPNVVIDGTYTLRESVAPDDYIKSDEE